MLIDIQGYFYHFMYLGQYSPADGLINMYPKTY